MAKIAFAFFDARQGITQSRFEALWGKFEGDAKRNVTAVLSSFGTRNASAGFLATVRRGCARRRSGWMHSSALRRPPVCRAQARRWSMSRRGRPWRGGSACGQVTAVSAGRAPQPTGSGRDEAWQGTSCSLLPSMDADLALDRHLGGDGGGRWLCVRAPAEAPQRPRVCCCDASSVAVFLMPTGRGTRCSDVT